VSSIPDLVSVILPVHNRPAFLGEAAASALAQMYRRFEILLVDDGSTDETPVVCEALRQAHPDVIRIVTRPNGGPGCARESGRALARGEFIQYLDSDDVLYPSKLERQVSALKTRPDCDIAYCAGRESWVDGSREARESARCSLQFDTLFPALLEGRVWPTLAPLYRRTLTDRLGPWTALRHEEDWEYDARAGALGARLVWCPEPLWEVRHHSGDRAGGGSEESAERMRSRVKAHELIYAHARRAGIGPEHPSLQHFARELFLLARQAGAVGLSRESRALFALARQASGTRRGRGLDFMAYRAAVAVFGWCRTARLANRMDKARSGRLGSKGGK